MSDPAPYAVSPRFRSTIAAVSKYLDTKASEFSPTLLEAGNELKRRLRRMENDANRLIKVNNILLDAVMPSVHLDQSTDTLTITQKGQSHSIKFHRADPNVPISLTGSAAGGDYIAGSFNTSNDSPNTDDLKMIMEQLLEHYYSNAFRVTKLVQQITGRPKYHCKPITIVRNKLIEHPESGSLYSFGFGTNGPVVKPMFRGERKWRDDGLVPNTETLIISLTAIFKNDT